LLAPRPTPKLEDHPSSAVRGCLFNLFTANLHIGGHSSIRNPRTCHAVVTGTHIMDIIYTSLIKCNIPDKLIKLIKITMQHTKMKVKVNNSYSEWFETKTGVRQGDPLSALLFSVVLDYVITNLEPRGNIATRLKDLCLCRRYRNNRKNKTS